MPRLRCGARHKHAGISLVEVMIAAAMITLTCSVVMFAFAQLNQMCMVSRLYTGASTTAQSQIDIITTAAPFQPFTTGSAAAQIPVELTPGTTTSAVTIYQDPISNLTINGTMTTVVTATTSSYANGTNTDTLYLYQAVVTVTYSYRNRSYSISMSTLRTSDV